MAAVKEVSRLICLNFKAQVCFPTEENCMANTMNRFEKIAGLPHFMGAIDGTHIR